MRVRRSDANVIDAATRPGTHSVPHPGMNVYHIHECRYSCTWSVPVAVPDNDLSLGKGASPAGSGSGSGWRADMQCTLAIGDRTFQSPVVLESAHDARQRQMHLQQQQQAEANTEANAEASEQALKKKVRGGDFLDFLSFLHARRARTWALGTCGGASETELTATRGMLNGSPLLRRARVRVARYTQRVAR